MASGDRTWNKSVGAKRVQSQHVPRQSYTQNIKTTFDDDYDDDDQDNDGIINYQSYSSRGHARSIENRRPFTPSTCPNAVESPSLKRKRGAADVLELMTSQMEKMLEHIDSLEQNVETLNRKCSNMAEDLTDVRKSQDQVRKSQDQVQKLTVRIAHTRMDAISDEPSADLPPITVDGKIVSITPLPPGGPTKLMCKLIRDLYSVQEINEGIPHDHRLAAIKEAVRCAYYSNDEAKFSVFWKMDGHRSIGNQKRSQAYRMRRRAGAAALVVGGYHSEDEQHEQENE